MKILAKTLSFIKNFIHPQSIYVQYFNSLIASRSVRRFTKKYLRFSPLVSKAINRKHPRYDRYLLKRYPKLDLLMNSESDFNIKTSDLYKPEIESRIDYSHYIALFKTIESVLRVVKPNSITEIGCSTGPLLEIINEHYPDANLKGVEGFPFYKDLAAESIKERIEIADLRKEVTWKETSDLVICMEVAEHIDPGCLDTFLENIHSLTNRYLVMSWSSTYPPFDAPPQHISPVSLQQYKKIMRKIGFIESRYLTDLFAKESINHEHFQEWWRKSGIVWEKSQ